MEKRIGETAGVIWRLLNCPFPPSALTDRRVGRAGGKSLVELESPGQDALQALEPSGLERERAQPGQDAPGASGSVSGAGRSQFRLSASLRPDHVALSPGSPACLLPGWNIQNGQGGLADNSGCFEPVTALKALYPLLQAVIKELGWRCMGLELIIFHGQPGLNLQLEGWRTIQSRRFPD